MGQRVSAWIRDDDLAEWLDQKIKSGEFRSVGHGVEQSLKLYREREDDSINY